MKIDNGSNNKVSVANASGNSSNTNTNNNNSTNFQFSSSNTGNQTNFFSGMDFSNFADNFKSFGMPFNQGNFNDNNNFFQTGSSNINFPFSGNT